jgi:mono/diheme cytochrome c family protein
LRKIWFLLPLYCFGEGDFISDYEYGLMLYHNPRGISCASCHGSDGRGKDIVEYINKEGKRVIIRGIDITYKSFDKIKKTVARNHPIMPKYYLTDEEVSAIYYYLQRKNFPEKFRTKKIEPIEEYIPPLEEMNVTSG